MPLSGTISSLTSEGQGIIRHDDLVVFVPFTAPRDRINFHITKQKKNFAVGSLDTIITPSPLRTFPKCPYFGTCGGCQLQHLSYTAQLDVKRQWIEDAMKRIGGLTVIVPPVNAAEDQWYYRRRINLVLKPANDAYHAGYTTTDNISFLPIAECPIFAKPDDPIISALQHIAQKLKRTSLDPARAILLKSNDQRYVVHFDFKQLPTNIDKAFEPLDPIFKSVSISSPKKSLHFGTIDQTMDIDGLTITFSPKAFIQAHPEQSLKIYKAIEDIAKKAKPLNTLDLYCGIGISSLLVARNNMAVTGIESNTEAIRRANHNAKINKLPNTRFLNADVGIILKKLLSKNNYDLAIVNPPREGLSPEVQDSLIQNPVKTLIYISCMPSTLARDLKHLCKNRYTLESIQAYDMFPQTVHVETMVVLTHDSIKSKAHIA